MLRLTYLIPVVPLLISSFTPIAQALSFGEAIGIGAGAIVINEAVQRTQRSNRGRNPEAEFNRGVEDGFARARYDNPRNSVDYSKGFDMGVKRRQQGWRGPFRQ